MSDSSYKLTASSRRQPVNRGQRLRPAQKPGQKLSGAKKPQPKGTKVNPNSKLGVPLPRKRIATAATKPVSTANIKGQIPPFNPNAVKVKSVRVRKQPLPRRTVVARRTRLKPMARNILYALRLLIVGVGIGAIVGTVLSVLDPATRLNTSTPSPVPTVGQTSQPNQSSLPALNSGLTLSQEIPALKSSIQNLAIASPNLTPGVFIADLDNGNYVDLNGGAKFAAASTIKIPILVAFFQDVDAGKISLDETMTTTKATVAGGSGDMQYQPVGTKYGILQVATKMITISDNTATNMLIERLGGIAALNERFRSWGLSTTNLRNVLPDIEGTNSTSPKELVNLIAMVSKGNLVSTASRDRILDIMRRTVKDNLLPSGIGQGATIAHKTGEIGGILADAGLVDLANGKRYLIATIVQRPRNDASAEKLISSISRATFGQFSQAGIAPNNPPSGTNIQPTPINPVQPPVVTSPLSHTNPVPMPHTGYQQPGISPIPSSSTYMTPIPNNMGGVPTTTYQSPVVTPQYYYPYQR